MEQKLTQEKPVLPPLAQINKAAASNSTGQNRTIPSMFGIQEVKKPAIPQPTMTSPHWQVNCNKCDKQVTNDHFHCSICDSGDYDLCEACVNAGAFCKGENHWLIKRSVKNGIFVKSTTETIAPKSKAMEPATATMPGAFTNENKPLSSAQTQPVRICNVCIRSEFTNICHYL